MAALKPKRGGLSRIQKRVVGNAGRLGNQAIQGYCRIPGVGDLHRLAEFQLDFPRVNGLSARIGYTDVIDRKTRFPDIETADGAGYGCLRQGSMRAQRQ